MYSIVDRQELTKRDMISLTVEAPAIARRIRPGQFVILRVNETGERLPLTVAYCDPVNGTITIIFQVVGKSTALLASLPVGDAIKDLAASSNEDSLANALTQQRKFWRFAGVLTTVLLCLYVLAFLVAMIVAAVSM